VLDLIKQMYPKAITLADIGITKTREARILQTIVESYSVPQCNPEKEAKRKRLEAFVQETRASETVAKKRIRVLLASLPQSSVGQKRIAGLKK